MRRSIQVVCVFLLLFAQQAALTHAAWHARVHTPAHQHDKNKASLQAELCALHGGFSQVLGAMPVAETLPAAPQLVSAAIPTHCDYCIALDPHLPRSRGPPELR